MQVKDLNGDHTFALPIPGQATAGTADEWPSLVVPFRCRITAAKWVPSAAVTANGANYATLGVRNRGDDGTGTAVAATRSYAATNSTAFVGDAMVLGASATLNLDAGDVVTVEKLVTGTGLAIPDGVVVLTVQAR